MVVLIRCNDIASDPRAMKYVRYLKETGQDYYLIGWDRDGKFQDTKTSIFYHHKAGYNVGGIKAVLNRIGWIVFVVKTLVSMKRESFLIHACDLDAAYPAIVYKKLFSKKNRCKVLFDVFDWFSATLHSQSFLVLSAFKHMESVSVKNCDSIIICEPERIEQIPYTINPEKLKVLPNIPYFSNSDFLQRKHEYEFNNNNYTFSYVGGFAQIRCINEIITLAEQGIVNLLIAGFGDSQIEERLKTLSNHPNIKYFGKVKYTDGLQIMYNSDVIYAMYSKVNPNNIYAAPNKYYEAMFLGKPLFSTIGTIVEKKVLSNRIGFVSEESIEEIKNIISQMSKSEIEEFGNNAHHLWVDKFCNFTSEWLKNDYQSLISENNK